jgi:hypothetical protein
MPDRDHHGNDEELRFTGTPWWNKPAWSSPNWKIEARRGQTGGSTAKLVRGSNQFETARVVEEFSRTRPMNSGRAARGVSRSAQLLPLHQHDGICRASPVPSLPAYWANLCPPKAPGDAFLPPAPPAPHEQPAVACGDGSSGPRCRGAPAPAKESSSGRHSGSHFHLSADQEADSRS